MGAPHASVWWATLPHAPTPRAPLDGDLDVDVVVVGAGYTGLWTALSLRAHDDGLRVAVLEADVAGAGASGRNGGWASALYPVGDARLVREHGRDATRRLRGALRAAVADLEREASALGIAFDYRRGGTVTMARSDLQAERLRRARDEQHALGDTDADHEWLDEAAARRRCGATEVRGALYTPHCAAIHPAKLATGLAAAAVSSGIELYERTRVTELVPGGAGRRPLVRTEHGAVRADVVVRATEGFTAQLAHLRRRVVPLYSLVVATEPLPAAFFDRVGLAERETFCDDRHLIIYGQRTADDRLVFGGRGAPYHFGSRVAPGYDSSPSVFAKLAATLRELFGDLGGAITHRWGGPIGVPRDFAPAVRFDRATGMASAGGYVGDGVVLSHLAARTLADLIVGADTDRTSLPFVGHRSRAWEPEPLRWLGINGGLLAAGLADRTETRTGRPSRLARVVDRLHGG